MVFAVSFEHFMTFRRTVISYTTTPLQLTLIDIQGMRLINITYQLYGSQNAVFILLPYVEISFQH